MARVTIPVACIEYEEGGNTLWVQGPEGATVLRIKTMGKITSTRCQTSPVPHADVIVREDIVVCRPSKKKADGFDKWLSKKMRKAKI